MLFLLVLGGGLFTWKHGLSSGGFDNLMERRDDTGTAFPTSIKTGSQWTPSPLNSRQGKSFNTYEIEPTNNSVISATEAFDADIYTQCALERRK